MRVVATLFAVALMLCALLGYRVVRLEQRVGALSKQLGNPPPADGDGKAVAQSPQGRGDYEQRLSALAREITALREDLQSLEEATGERPPPTAAFDAPGGEQRILSVIEREQNRIRDRQLQFHRARWLEWRQEALDKFAQMHNLSPVQTQRVYEVLAAEIEALVELMKRPDFAENPERAASDWLERLELTDSAAHEILDPPQRFAWDAARTHERNTFWPWLPKE
jgi:hypothetical protein